MSVPGWWAFLLLGLAAFRTWRLDAEDTILDRPRAWVIGRFPKAETFIGCPWCSGAWFAVAWWTFFEAWPHWTLVVAAPFALSAIVALIAVHGDPE